MITKIHPPRTSFNDTLSYMEKKVELGKGIMLDKSLYEEKPSLYWKEFKEIANLNERVTNKCLHISINLDPSEQAESSKLIEIGKEYLDKMGYSNCPYIIYQHNDTNHSHIHLILSSVDYDGKWVSDSFSHERSFTISREIEKTHNLKNLEYGVSNYNKRHYALSEKAMLDNSFRNGLRRALKDPKAIPYIEHFMQKEEINEILSSCNNKVSEMILNDRFSVLNDYLMNQGYCSNHIKGELLKVLDQAIKEPTKDSYFKFLEDNGVKVSVNSYQGKTKYSYKLSDYDYTFKENRLPKNFCFSEINKRLGSYKGDFILKDEQKHILYMALRVNVQASGTISEFLENLSKSNIHHTTSDSSQGKEIYFSLNNTDNSFTFKGEDIFKAFSYESITSHYNRVDPIKSLDKETISDIAFISEEIFGSSGINLRPSSGVKGYEDNTNINRKNKKKKRRGENRSLL